MWIALGLVSCFFLGLYDITKKVSLSNNAVIPVLFFASLTGALIFVPFAFLSHWGILPEHSIFFVPSISLKAHGLLLMKSTLVASTWFFAYYALKHLPITIVTPIRATGPIWTLIGALIIYKEQYSALQWIGMAIVLGFFYFFSLAGKHEGINFKRNIWIVFIMLATLLGSISTLYDKYLIAHYDRMAVQTWFSIYLIPVFLPFMMFMWYPERKKSKPFEWRWAIPLIGILLTIGDFAYYFALSDPDMLITILSVLRRTSVIISFTIGAIIFKEINLKRKAFALFGIFVGVIIMVLGS